MSNSRALVVQTVRLEAHHGETIRSIERQQATIDDLSRVLSTTKEKARILQAQRQDCHPSRVSQTISAREMRAIRVQRDGIEHTLASLRATLENHRSRLDDEHAKLEQLKARQLEVEVEKKSIERALERQRLRDTVAERRKLDEPDL